ncbi:hypothetical protein ACM26V_16070 [Salipaludibacillus sp. HK11]|uniref:hypothetical protein n=1 Tax=Salipaludibacillus sp. HK11 TaxID=3394320 RepID=UPI0039FCFBA2
MRAHFGKEGSQEGAACAPCRAELERKGHKKEQLVPHVERNWKGRVTRRSSLCPMSSGIGKEGSQEGAACAPCRAELERKGHKKEQLVPHVERNWKGSVTRESGL